ncbi:glutamate-5-semialdehyde dehydrogenase [Feifania hominis]|uniref:Gamma-glutamyl phosphate reductase n=1 Tax=Feifania hominis TaxID=2763660 RepID=A0A926HR85_9FIRM|nr:glutamate-5-semialdehyde dehydrogenase [Feifania hominis]MBC8537152.1 glutamate-5-semialdehyde dehydrogenase [Feifania hominis]
MTTREMAQRAKHDFIALQALPHETKNAALGAIADALLRQEQAIVEANRLDLAEGERTALAPELLRRLKFDHAKIATCVEGIRQLIAMPDPVGRTLWASALDEGLELYRVACPIGVIGVIFESRPDALVQILSLCLKSGNAVLLKGGSEAANTNRALADVIHAAAVAEGVPDGFMHLLTSRGEVGEMLALDEYVDLIIPRGSNAFVRYIMDHSRIPVMGHADGICHVYIDRAADPAMAVDITVDSKTQYVAVCNAAETLLVHADAAAAVLPRLKAALEARGVELRGCARTRAVIDCSAATEQDFHTEYLDYILSIKVVDSLDEAIDHINAYGSHHTDCIVTGDAGAAERFLQLVDSANVYHNCSTRFADGFRYGFGAEVGISTNKLHARGPVGLEGLLTYKYLLCGHGQIVADYAEGRRHFRHTPLDKPYR